MPHAIINGARLWYETPGNPSANARPLLLHHGYTASRVNWAPVAERLQDTYRVILMECRGTGDSEDTADGYSLEQYALDVLGMADHLNLQTFTYAGHSMGGGVGFLLGLDHATRLDGLILMAPIPSGGTSALPPQAAIDRRLQARAAKDRDFFMAEMVANRYRPEIQTDAWFNLRIDHLLRVSEGHLLGGLSSMHTLDVEARLPELALPTLMLAGAVDGLLRANLNDYMRLPDAGLHVFSQAGHDVAIYEPDGVSQAIHGFMQHGSMNANKLAFRATVRG